LKPLKLGKWTPYISGVNSSIEESHTTPVSNKYFGCNSSSCFVKSQRIKADFANQLVLVFGCSLDMNAIAYFCSASTGLPMEHFSGGAPLSYLCGCTVGPLTIAYVFHPGASPPPYSQGYNSAIFGTSQAVVTKAQHDALVRFGRAPTAVVVDASLWDVGSWWEKAGKPPFPYLIPPAFTQQWCNKDMPEFLAHVGATFPNTPIAFRTAPTIFAGPNGYGLSATSVEDMVHCVELRKDGLGRIFGTFGLIDYHHFVDDVLTNAGASAPTYYKDALHPGAQLSLTYINSILTWVQATLHLAR